jgi:hypothetical protein
VKESTRDIIEDATASIVEAVVSSFPFVGGPAAIVVNRAFGSAVQRKRDEILADMRSDIDLVLVNMNSAKIIEIVSSDEFVSAVSGLFAASQSTSDQEKRKLLRAALRNGLRPEWAAESEHFRNLLLRCEYEDVAVLTELAERSSATKGAHAHSDGWVSSASAAILRGSAVARITALSERRVNAILDRLVSEALIDLDESSELIDSSTTDDNGNLVISDGQVDISRQHRPSPVGVRFLRFLS